MKNTKDNKEELFDIQLPFIVFKLGNEEYAIKIEKVKEVTITPSITKMPKTPDFVKGVANIRGDIVAIMDMEERFGIQHVIQDTARIKNTYTLVTERENYTVGLMVREVPQTLTIPFSNIDKTPNFFVDVNIHERYIDGIAKHDGRLIILLDIDKILTYEEEQQLINN